MLLFTQFLSLLNSQPVFFFAIVACFGLAIGSFLNVVIYRLPKILTRQWYYECREYLADELTDKPAQQLAEISLSSPNSCCPHCQHQIRFYENIPLVSWLFLRGKCSQCQQGISIRYPIVELVTSLLSVVVAYHYGVHEITLFVLLFTWCLIALTLIDFDHMLLPDQIVLPLLWLGLLININGLIVPLEQAVIGAAVGYGSLYSIFWLFKLLTGKEGMGHGDFKLFAVFGAWLGWQLLPLLILMASAVGALVGIYLMLFANHKKGQAIPFGPYLAIAGWITLLWGESIWTWYLGKVL